MSTVLAVAPVPEQRLVKGAPGRLRFTVTDADGAPYVPGAAPTLSAVDADGATKLATAPMTADEDAGDGAYYLDVAATDVDALGVWAVTITVDGAPRTITVDVAPARLITVRELLGHEPEIDPDPEVIRPALLAAELEVEWIAGRSFVPRWHRFTVDGTGNGNVRLPVADLRDLLGLTVDGVAWDTSTVALDGETLRHTSRPFPAGVGNVVATVVAGWDAPPADLRRALARRVRAMLYEGTPAHPDRAQSITADGATWSLRDPGPLEVGIGWVDAIYARHSARKSLAGGEGGDAGGLAPAYGRIDVDPGADSRLFRRHR